MSNNKIIIHTDGASRGNPGPSGAGVHVSGLGEPQFISIFLGNKTNNEAEYLALLAAVRFLLQFKKRNAKNDELGSCEVVFKMDSMLVVKQMNGEWKIKESRMLKLAEKVRSSLKTLDMPFKFLHVERSLNQEADWLATQVIDLGT
jgi:ribonuclease HI